MCSSIDHDMVSGDDRGGIAVSASNVFYTGDVATVRASLTDLGGLASVGAQHDSMLSDLASGEVYVLLNEADAGPVFAPGSSFTPLVATQLGVLNGSTGALTATRIPLSSPITLTFGSGVFSGRGRAYVFSQGPGTSNSTWSQIRLPSGTVTTIRAMAPSVNHQYCESWGFWGVAEYFGGAPYAVFVETGLSIVRYRISDGSSVPLVTTGAAPNHLSDMCSLTFSPARNRWYFHYEGTGFAGGTAETLGYCPGTFSTP